MSSPYTYALSPSIPSIPLSSIFGYIIQISMFRLIKKTEEASLNRSGAWQMNQIFILNPQDEVSQQKTSTAPMASIPDAPGCWTIDLQNWA